MKPLMILIVLSGAQTLSLKEGGTHPTGVFLSELTEALAGLKKAGYSVVFANPTGHKSAIAPESDDPRWFSSEKEYREAKQLLASYLSFEKPRRFETLTEGVLEQFAGVFVPGGYAPMEDLPNDKALGRILSHFHVHKKPTALICHGPIALLSNRSAYEGYRVTIVSKKEEIEEEEAGHLGGHQLYYVEDALRRDGLDVHVAKPWSSHVLRDREVITGQNPMSAKALTTEFIKALTR